MLFYYTDYILLQVERVLLAEVNAKIMLQQHTQHYVA
jgi:hypothetical protein